LRRYHCFGVISTASSPLYISRLFSPRFRYPQVFLSWSSCFHPFSTATSSYFPIPCPSLCIFIYSCSLFVMQCSHPCPVTRLSDIDTCTCFRLLLLTFVERECHTTGREIQRIPATAVYTATFVDKFDRERGWHRQYRIQRDVGRLPPIGVLISVSNSLSRTKCVHDNGADTLSSVFSLFKVSGSATTGAGNLN